jgi:hypothetical protein
MININKIKIISNNSLCIKWYLLIILVAFFNCATIAQQKRDTTKKPSIDITSSYKPVLRNAVKINFSASYLNPDSSKQKLDYTVPAQNLLYAYQPISIKPLALQADTNLYLGQRNFIKAGFGNFSTPFVEAGFSFGDAKKSLVNFYGSHISSKGKIKFQDYSLVKIKASGSFLTSKNELYVGGTIKQNTFYLYGYDKVLYPSFTKDALRQQFQDIDLSVGFRNIITTNYSISYNPTVHVFNFSNRNKATESTIVVNAPIEKTFGDAFALKIAARADLTSYTTKGLIPNNVKVINNIAQLPVSLSITTPRFSINGGIIPTWDNGQFIWLPNFYAEGYLKEKLFMIQAGWVGTYIKNTFRNLAAINPYLLAITNQTNTREVEYYGGIKGTLGNHFSFNAKAGYVSYTNFQLFVNDTATDEKSFKVAYERKAQNLRVHGDLSYINQDKFTLTAGLTFNGYTAFNNNGKAWNTVPMELTGALRWHAYKQVLIKADFYMFGGGNYLTKNNTSKSFKTGTDLSAGAEFKVNKMFSAWLDFNNILNNKYERWHNYEVYGFNVLGGLRITF